MFAKINVAQSKFDFVKNCFKDPSAEQAKVAIAIRNAIATLGKIESKFIRAEASFEDLDSLPFWSLCGDAGFNTVKFIEAIELELGIHFLEEKIEHSSVRDPDLNIHMKIHEFINEFYIWYEYSRDTD
ncbi:MAG: aldehyde dehydrogenase [Oscillatoria sp. PMC 1051.18]|uniref:aldehyde dehydrogenase n=1 Tax=Oscillatoria salina TaxID=331517 RepID=UPI0013B881A7|nr:aldehyde dehydrogenase [Oscillatoria salina]MBZ8178669.1 aldehyde dehydrogenase [Oscillatoria salina IIICB1]MEC4896297.1 aldehyde dehydrogenase [Oscillatoria sp. PMC 1050.18]MEC5029894.1 aldehyde dehydrogenase [Oscillatoria sp. PMC 1051.18]NET91430.1 aldehyde dehydrogenase [Kamptonema sp. SIO1D9]